MTEVFRLRPSSRTAVLVSLGVSLSFTTLAFAADYPSPRVEQSLKASRSASSPALTARAALFERNLLPRAAKLAKSETVRSPRNVDSWFLRMETAHAQQDRPAELSSALVLCKLAKPDDPRLTVATLRLSQLGDNSEAFASHRQVVEKVANADAPCADAAAEALYTASLAQLDSSSREWALRSGWLTKWTISRLTASGNPPAAEQFEFPDAQIHLPDYFPRSGTYLAESEFLARVAGSYRVSGDIAGVKVVIDNNEVSGPVNLSAGSHTVRLTFRGSSGPPRLRISKEQEIEFSWSRLHLSSRETGYLRAAVALARGDVVEAAEQIRNSELKSTIVGHLLFTAATELPPSEAGSVGSLSLALSLAAERRHPEAIDELARFLQVWPLNREAHRLLISELQIVGNNAAADRAAADFLAIAPNARNFRRMAKNAAVASEPGAAPFYTSYRRHAPQPIPTVTDSPAILLLQDKVAIARPDGSVSVYMHRVVQLMTTTGAQEFQPAAIPDGAQVITSRIINRAASVNEPLQAGDEVETEYVVNYTGDGGILAHPEAFQCVFNDFDYPLLDARFVVLSPASQNPIYVIASGDVAPPRVEFSNGLRVQVWEKAATSASTSPAAPAIIRVVENENGWSTPPSIERRRILETIHPGPRNREA